MNKLNKKQSGKVKGTHESRNSMPVGTASNPKSPRGGNVGDSSPNSNSGGMINQNGSQHTQIERTDIEHLIPHTLRDS